MSEVRNYFYNGGLNCAETTMKCLIEDGIVDLPPETVRMMTGFGGGMQRGAVCGSVVAVVAAIGARTGRISCGESREESAQLEALAETQAYTVVGGGDSVTASRKYKVADRLGYVCTGGGALIRFLTGEELPVVKALRHAAAVFKGDAK